MSLLVTLSVYFAYFALVRNAPMAGYMDATDFLLYWYCLWAGVLSLLALVVMFVTIFKAGTKTAEDIRKPLTKLLSFISRMVGAGAGLFGTGLFGVLRVSATFALGIGGAWLLSHADDHVMSLETLDKTKLILGSLMVLLSVFLDKRSKNNKPSTTTP